jgi:serine O-acetyltransferase
MLENLICELLGGFWGIRERIQMTNTSWIKKFLILIYTLYLQKKCCYIGYDSKFRGQPVFPHGFFGIFISGNAELGKNCVIFQNVTIGSNTLPDSKNVGSPKIGDNVFIGSGATIIGNIYIGDNCRIGANCTITIDIPSNCVVVSEKPKILTKDGLLSNKYYSFSPKEGWVFYDDGIYKKETDMKIVEILNLKFRKT